MPDAGILATMLLLLGWFLLGLEFFIPSFGMILAIAVISLIVSFWSACKAWWGVNPAFFWTYVVLLVAGIPGSLMSAVAIMQKTSFGNRMILRPPPVDEKKPNNPLDELIGQRGTAQTLLTPGGMVSINSERFHAESLGMLIEPQTPVIVVATRANRIVVRPWTADDDKESQRLALDPLPVVDTEVLDPATTSKNTSSDSRSSLPPIGNEKGDRLDFEIPDDYTHLPKPD
ncbi:MAG: NfeD family protein [Fuerstia sp.]|nr:NfeD family protein [Fuerstiella sp.]